jgi:hypothetical protein
MLCLFAVALVGGSLYAVYLLSPCPPNPFLPFAPLVCSGLCVLVVGPLWPRLIPTFVSPWTLEYRFVPLAERVWRVRACLDSRSFIHSSAYVEDEAPLSAPLLAVHMQSPSGWGPAEDAGARPVDSLPLRKTGYDGLD